MAVNLNPPRGFRDFYPEDKKTQEYIFSKLKKIADSFGFSSYDGPILEDIKIYLNKTSKELINRQTFTVKTKDETLVMRPEMTPSLARMIAKATGKLTFPQKLFNLGLRFRYEAPQKGREREFYQADFDILARNSVLADAEILNVAVAIFTSFGAGKKDFVVYINSRQEMEESLLKLDFSQKQYKRILGIIDKKDKIPPEKLEKMLFTIESDKKKIEKLIIFLNTKGKNNSTYFGKLFFYLEKLGIADYCKINYNIVRGLDYYTGLVFEVWEKEPKMRRALLGGGRYDNLIANFNPKNQINGVGFATSDVVLWEFLKNKKLLPQMSINKTKVFVTIFSEETVGKSLNILNLLRKNNVAVEISLDDKKIDKQLKYANRKSIPYAVILGPEEIEKNIYKLKDMKTGLQKNLTENELIKSLT